MVFFEFCAVIFLPFCFVLCCMQLHSIYTSYNLLLLNPNTINFLASVVYIHMDDQIDGKTLVGSYVCTEQPGEFRWQPGSLTQVCCKINMCF